MRTNDDWLRELSSSGAAQESAISDLQSILLRAVLYIFNRNSGDPRSLDGDDKMKLAEDCAQDALISILNHLPDFRGDSKFTTWAYKFAVNIALMSARHERWKDVSLDQLSAAEDGEVSEWLMEDKPPTSAPGLWRATSSRPVNSAVLLRHTASRRHSSACGTFVIAQLALRLAAAPDA